MAIAHFKLFRNATDPPNVSAEISAEILTNVPAILVILESFLVSGREYADQRKYCIGRCGFYACAQSQGYSLVTALLVNSPIRGLRDVPAKLIAVSKVE